MPDTIPKLKNHDSDLEKEKVLTLSEQLRDAFYDLGQWKAIRNESEYVPVTGDHKKVLIYLKIQLRYEEESLEESRIVQVGGIRSLMAMSEAAIEASEKVTDGEFSKITPEREKMYNYRIQCIEMAINYLELNPTQALSFSDITLIVTGKLKLIV